jgi:glycine/D-amino acid oxidase-like deaminating enzyme
MVKTYRSIDIIGGGIIGITLATELLRIISKYNLKTEVHLFEKQGQLGIENTEKSFEGVRTFWFTRDELKFYLFSIHAFCDLERYFNDIHWDRSDPEAIRINANYRQVGYHYFFSNQEFQTLLKMKQLFEEAGIPLEYYSKDEAQKINWIANNFNLNGRISFEDTWIIRHFNLDAWREMGFDLREIIPQEKEMAYPIEGYIRVPFAGFISAGEVVASCRWIFEKMGGYLHLNTVVTDFDCQGNRIEAIRFQSHGSENSKHTDFVVNAAGIWSESLHQKLFGESLGVTPHRRYAHIVNPPKGYQTDHGMVLLRNRVIRPDGDKIWLYYTPEEEKPGIETRQPDARLYDTYFFKYIYPVFCDPHNPFIRSAETLGLFGSVDARGWMGHYADTPDERPLIGIPRPNHLNNYAVSTGYSGHGVQASIGAAAGLAHQILHPSGESKVIVPNIYTADRDLSLTRPDHSRL